MVGPNSETHGEEDDGPAQVGRFGRFCARKWLNNCTASTTAVRAGVDVPNGWCAGVRGVRPRCDLRKRARCGNGPRTPRTPVSARSQTRRGCAHPRVPGHPGRAQARGGGRDRRLVRPVHLAWRARARPPGHRPRVRGQAGAVRRPAHTAHTRTPPVRHGDGGAHRGPGRGAVHPLPQPDPPVFAISAAVLAFLSPIPEFRPYHLRRPAAATDGGTALPAPSRSPLAGQASRPRRGGCKWRAADIASPAAPSGQAAMASEPQDSAVGVVSRPQVSMRRSPRSRSAVGRGPTARRGRLRVAPRRTGRILPAERTLICPRGGRLPRPLGREPRAGVQADERAPPRRRRAGGGRPRSVSARSTAAHSKAPPISG